MNKLFAFLLTLSVCLMAGPVWAWDPPPTPKPVSAIADPAGVLSHAAHARLDAKLAQINQSSANELAALILPSLDGEDISDVGIVTAKAWGVGKSGLDNGVMVVLSMKEHKSRIDTGKGVEGDLPDLKCNDILKNARPYLRKGDVEGALSFIFDSSASAIANHKADLVAGRTTSNRSSSCDVAPGTTGDAAVPTVIFVGFITALLVFALVWRAKMRKEQEHQMKLLQEEQQHRYTENLKREERARISREAEQALLRAKELDQFRRLEFEKLAKEAKLRTERMFQETQHKTELKVQTPFVPVPVVPSSKRTTSTTHPPITKKEPRAYVAPIAPVVVPVVVAIDTSAEDRRRCEQEEEQVRYRRAEEDRKAREREEEDRKRRAREESERKRKTREEADRRNSSSPDWGSSSSGGSSSGGDFGGGSFGGGGSSSDW